MQFQDIDAFDHCLGMLSILLLFREFGKLDDLLRGYRNVEISCDFEWEFFFAALESSVEVENVRYIECEECDEHFLSDATMTEYYRLCKEYGRRHRLRFKENPYVIKAEAYVVECMNEIDDYGFGWRLSTGTRHRCASALHCFLYPDFEQTVSLIHAVLDIFAFYHREIEVLKEELAGESGGEEVMAA